MEFNVSSKSPISPPYTGNVANGTTVLTLNQIYRVCLFIQYNHSGKTILKLQGMVEVGTALWIIIA